MRCRRKLRVICLGPPRNNIEDIYRLLVKRQLGDAASLFTGRQGVVFSIYQDIVESIAVKIVPDNGGAALKDIGR